MKKLMLSLLGIAAISSIGFAGTETYSGKEMKQVAAPPPCPEWYADQEFNVSLWGTYLFTGNEWKNDRYMLADHGWGGGIDFNRIAAMGLVAQCGWDSPRRLPAHPAWLLRLCLPAGYRDRSI